MTTKHPFKAWLFRYSTLTAIWGITVAFLLLLPGDKFPNEEPIPYLDKVVHVGIFGVFSFLFANAFKRSSNNASLPSKIILSFAITLIYSAGLELLQNYVPGRQFDVGDLMANGTGITIGLILFAIICKF